MSVWLPSICPSNEIPSAREERASASAQLALERRGIELRSSLWCGGKPHEAVHVRADTHQMVAMDLEAPMMHVPFSSSLALAVDIMLIEHEK